MKDTVLLYKTELTYVMIKEENERNENEKTTIKFNFLNENNITFLIGHMY